MEKRIAKVLLCISIACTIVLAFGFVKAITEDPSSAKANQVQGLFIFSYSKPVSSTEYLGTLKIPAIFSDKGEERINKLIKLCKKEFPKAEGIIVNEDFSKGDAITFKNEK